MRLMEVIARREGATLQQVQRQNEAATHQEVPVDLARQVVRIRQERSLHANSHLDNRFFYPGLFTRQG
jgi:hypothetical protein